MEVPYTLTHRNIVMNLSKAECVQPLWLMKVAINHTTLFCWQNKPSRCKIWKKEEFLENIMLIQQTNELLDQGRARLFP